jgi:uncharacterized RDD family membrane protein YckC
LGAALMDGIILGTIRAGFMRAITGSLSTPRRWLGLAYLLTIVGHACYDGLFIGRLGATPGKLAAGIRIIRTDGSRVGAGRAFGRYFAKLLSFFALGIGYIMVAFDSEKRGLHDMICDTRVVNARN